MRSCTPRLLALLALLPAAARSQARDPDFPISDNAAFVFALHDVQGRVVRLLADGVTEAGHHVVRLGTEALAPGIHLMRLQAPGVDLRQRVAVLH